VLDVIAIVSLPALPGKHPTPQSELRQKGFVHCAQPQKKEKVHLHLAFAG
jgi:hypothetical protein